MSSDEEDFVEQLRLEQLEKAGQETGGTLEHGRVRKEEDGTEYQWDAQRKAWFPKINEDFIATYQMQYGATAEPQSSDSNMLKNPPPEVESNPAAYWKYYYGDEPPRVDDPNYSAWYAYTHPTIDPSQALDAPDLEDPAYPIWYYKQCYGVDPDESDEQYKHWASSFHRPSTTSIKKRKIDEQEESAPNSTTTDPDSKTKKTKPTPTWFEQEEEHNSSVYVLGLPEDITLEEFKEMMTKCGLIAFDHERKQPKLKLYKNSDGKPKGDGLCTYIKRESVALAIQLLDESDFRGSKIGVQLAKFEIKGSFDPTLRKKPKNNKLKRKLKEKQDKLLDWRPDKLPDERNRSERTVVLRNIFDPKEFDENPEAIQEIRDDMRVECGKYGEMKKITIHDRNSDGVIVITYKEFEEADLCIQALNNRWFGGRQVKATSWDGRERFEVKETAEQEAERIKKWDEYLEQGSSSSVTQSKQKSIPVSLPVPESRVISEVSAPKDAESAQSSCT